MKNLFAAFFSAVLFCASPVLAQGLGPMGPGPGTPHTSAVSYIGPGDLQTFAMWWSPSSAYSSATRGAVAFNACSPADATCADVSSNASTGLVAMPTVGGTLCNTSTYICTVKIKYDGSGSGYNLTQTTIASRARLAPCSFNSAIACEVCAAACDYVSASNYGSAYRTFLFTSSRTANFTTSDAMITLNDLGSNSWNAGHSNSANTVFTFDNSGGGHFGTETASDSAFHVVQGSANGTLAGVLSVDGSLNNSHIGGGVGSNGPVELYTTLSGQASETGLIGSAISDADIVAMNANIHARLGF